MSPIGSPIRPAARVAATPTGALGFVTLSAYLTVQFTVLDVIGRSDFITAMAVFSTGVLLAALSAHLRLVAAGRFAEGAEADRNGLSRVSLQVLVACTVLSGFALLAGSPGDHAPALALAITALVAGAVRLVISIVARR
ncbi:hypothetical protein [Amnibacterium sp.]|uniref:hypothetical protein n=1 Tax=Amnibacterium sp. TaxID=1872496 RepID=UPI00261FC059|nr:hypothetical protein [Amnibacterium sp.]MCU1473391.1 hypothetical protein [Amnibacterium sp.]